MARILRQMDYETVHRIEVTQAHIDHGQKNNKRSCAFSYALIDHFKSVPAADCGPFHLTYPSVEDDWTTFTLDKGLGRFRIRTPASVRRMLQDFDAGRPVAPFSVNIDLNKADVIRQQHLSPMQRVKPTPDLAFSQAVDALIVHDPARAEKRLVATHDVAAKRIQRLQAEARSEKAGLELIRQGKREQAIQTLTRGRRIHSSQRRMLEQVIGSA